MEVNTFESMEDENINLTNNNKINYIEDKSYNPEDYVQMDKGSEMKMLSNRWSEIINWSLDKGIQHFAITINTLKSNDFIYNDNYGVNDLYTKISNLIIRNFPTLVFMQIVTELNKKDITHFHIIIGIRNFIDYNYILKNNIFTLLNRELVREGEDISLSYGTKLDYEFDIKVNSLKHFKDIKNWAIYLYKDMYIWKYPSHIYFTKCFWDEPVEYCSNTNDEDFVNKIYNCLYAFAVFMHDCGTTEIKLELIIVKVKNSYLNIISNLNGVQLRDNRLNKKIILDLIEYYLILNNLYIYNDNVYKKIEGFNISYELVGSITNILYSKFKENILLFFVTNFKMYFSGFDFYYLLTNDLMKSKQIIKEIGELSTNKIVLDFSLMEFTDGVYSITYDRFIPAKYIKENTTNKSTIKYYNKSYHWVRQNRPKEWIKVLKGSLGLNTENIIELDKNFIRIAKSIGLIFQEDSIKQSTLFIHGPSDSGKTLLIANILLEYFGKENIGSVVSAKNFKWQDIENKKIVILDEGRYNSSMSSDLLKIMNKENILVEKKYSDKHISLNPSSIFILSNTLFDDKNKDVNDALYRRMLVVEFISSLYLKNINDNINIKKDIKLEEANIILLCNKVFFKYFKEKSIYKNFNNILQITNKN